MGKDKCWRHFHTGQAVIQYVQTPENIAAKSCIIMIKYSHEQYLVSQSHNIEYTIVMPKHEELITNSYKNTLALQQTISINMKVLTDAY